MEGLDGWKMIFSKFKKVILQVKHIWNMTSLEFSPKNPEIRGDRNWERKGAPLLRKLS